MKTLFVIAVFCVLLATCWPLALVLLVLLPIFWLLSLPFVLFGLVVTATFALLRALLMLPARLLGHRPG